MKPGLRLHLDAENPAKYNMVGEFVQPLEARDLAEP